MKGVILSINRNVKIIDITHSIQPQNVNQGAFILYSNVDFFTDAVHVAVVDPRVGTERQAIVFKCKNAVLVGPDNGLLVPAAERLGIDVAIKISNTDFFLKNISSTFHGRDIFAPVAAHISNGVELENVGEKIDRYETIDLFSTEENEDRINGKVLNIDRFGNIITNIHEELISKYFSYGDNIEILYNSDLKILAIPFNKTYDNVPKFELVALVSSSGFLELAGNHCKANEKLLLRISDEIIIRKP
jgi:S-adenosylmethionine hydrolase